jgi:hypothetical protein
MAQYEVKVQYKVYFDKTIVVEADSEAAALKQIEDLNDCGYLQPELPEMIGGWQTAEGEMLDLDGFEVARIEPATY